MSLPKTADEGTGDTTAVARGQVHRYPVTEANGKTRHQLILVVSDPDPDTGHVRGVPLIYEDQAASIDPAQFAAGTAES
jgi:hypothetical protein